jgi:hypothetical protein
MSTVRLTRHAEARRREHGYTSEEVEAAALDPELTYLADQRRGRGRMIHQHGRVAIVHSGDGIIITVMPSGRTTGYQPWEHSPNTDDPDTSLRQVGAPLNRAVRCSQAANC